MLAARDRVLLEGPLGAGKSTFARALIQSCGVSQPAEGSPTFAIAHEYMGRSVEVIHVDFYRLRSEAEITETGIDEYFWSRDAIVIAEWASLFPGFEKALLKPRDTSGKILKVDMGFESDPTLRSVRITQL